MGGGLKATTHGLPQPALRLLSWHPPQGQPNPSRRQKGPKFATTGGARDLDETQKTLAGLSTRRYGAGLEPVGEQVQAASRSTSRSAVSRKFKQLTEHAPADLLAADLSGLDLVALMVDGVHFAETTCACPRSPGGLPCVWSWPLNAAMSRPG